MQTKPTSAYVHIPFCVKKCYYCDFCSYPNKLDLQKDYVHTLKEEIKLRSKEIKNYVEWVKELND